MESFDKRQNQQAFPNDVKIISNNKKIKNLKNQIF